MGGGFSTGGADGLPAPFDFFERPVAVDEGKTSRWDVDLRTDALGTIDGAAPEALRGAALAECAPLFGGKPCEGLVFWRMGDVRGGRFQLENLLPGGYRVWLQNDRGARLAEAEL